MHVGLLGRKVGMTQIYQENGAVVPITVLECGPCTVLQVRTADKDGYHAWQLGFADKKRKKATQAERGHAKKVGGEPKRFVREVRQDGPTEVNAGQILTVELFNPIAHVDKRMHRHPGSSGPSADPARTQKGIKKPGQFGNARVTVRNLEVVKIDHANNLLLIKGAVPGPNGGFITVRQTNRV
jgi:large subunit ribosomal protein L3